MTESCARVGCRTLPRHQPIPWPRSPVFATPVARVRDSSRPRPRLQSPASATPVARVRDSSRPRSRLQSPAFATLAAASPAPDSAARHPERPSTPCRASMHPPSEGKREIKCVESFVACNYRFCPVESHGFSRMIMPGAHIACEMEICYNSRRWHSVGVIRFRRDVSRSGCASWILVGHVKNEGKK